MKPTTSDTTTVDERAKEIQLGRRLMREYTQSQDHYNKFRSYPSKIHEIRQKLLEYIVGSVWSRTGVKSDSVADSGIKLVQESLFLLERYNYEETDEFLWANIPKRYVEEIKTVWANFIDDL